MAYGFVYVAINSAMPGLAKIGYTLISPSERVRQLSRLTSVPVPFELYCAFESDSPEQFERELHQEFALVRCSENREFFKVEPLDIYEAALEIGNFDHEIMTVAVAYDRFKKEGATNEG